MSFCQRVARSRFAGDSKWTCRDKPTPIRRLVPVTLAGYLEHKVKVSERLIPRPVRRSLHMLVHPSLCHPHSQRPLTSIIKKRVERKKGIRRYAWTLRPVWMKRQQTVQVKGENGGNGRWGGVVGRVWVRGLIFRALVINPFFPNMYNCYSWPGVPYTYCANANLMINYFYYIYWFSSIQAEDYCRDSQRPLAPVQFSVTVSAESQQIISSVYGFMLRDECTRQESKLPHLSRHLPQYCWFKMNYCWSQIMMKPPCVTHAWAAI